MTSAVVTPPDEADAPTSTTAALLAPWIGIVAPARASAQLLHATGGAVALSAVVNALLCAAAVIAVNLGFDLFRGWVIGPNRGNFLGNLWREYHPNGPIGPLEIAFILVAGGVLILPLLGTILYLPGLSAAGRIGEGFARGYRAGVAVLAWLALLIFLFGGLAVFTEFCTRVELLGDHRIWRQILASIYVPGLIWWLVFRVSQSYAAARPACDPHAAPPVCEGCGYGLTVLPTAGRCPECALNVDESLVPGRRRTGSRWQQLPTLLNWVRDALDIFLRPSAFYRSLRVRGDLAPLQAFARWNFVALSVVAWVWGHELFCYERLKNWTVFSPYGATQSNLSIIGLLLLALPLPALLLVIGTGRIWMANGRDATFAGPVVAGTGTVIVALASAGLAFATTQDSDVSVVPLAIGLLAPLVCWLGQRALGGIATAVAFWSGMLPDGRWAEKVVLCESVVMWVFCAWWGLLVTSFTQFNDWLTKLIGQRFSYDVLGIPAEPAAILYGTGLLTLAALLRYRFVFRAIRWANF